MTDAPHCYRHPSRETRVSCSECGRPICEECMTFAPVGIRCPEHANIGAVKPVAAADAPERRADDAARSQAPATMVLIAINVGDLHRHRRARRWHQPSRRHALHPVGAAGRVGRERRLVAARRRDVPPWQHPPSAVQHAGPLLARHDHRAGARHAAIPPRLLRLGARRLGRSSLVQLRVRGHGRRLRVRSSASSARCSSSSTSRPAR